ncbi:MAG: transketolase [Oligoflexia bacterium]|nr:transketolase [Oligoflexia bacterium]
MSSTTNNHINHNNYRSEVINCLIPFTRKNPKIILLVSDMGFGVCDRFKEEFPDRIINMGIMEQATVGIAAGMAMSGMLPVVYSIVNFLVFRAIEQIRNDVVLQGLNVKFIASGVNDYFKFLGPSHCCGDDDKKLMELIGMRVFDPYEVGAAATVDFDFDQMFSEWITNNGPGYIRV